MRIGQGFDAHRFASRDAGKPLWLACLRWDGDGIEGDSDGDVAAHALVDALLSALCLVSDRSPTAPANMVPRCCKPRSII